MQLADLRPLLSENGEAFLDVPVHGAVPVRSRTFRDWFTLESFNYDETVPTLQTLHGAIRYLEAAAHADGEAAKQPVFRRIASAEPKDHTAPNDILLDLADST